MIAVFVFDEDAGGVGSDFGVGRDFGAGKVFAAGRFTDGGRLFPAAKAVVPPVEMTPNSKNISSLPLAPLIELIWEQTIAYSTKWYGTGY